MSSNLEQTGHPRIKAFQRARRTARAVHEMIGLVQRVILDGEVTPAEAEFLAAWMKANPEVVNSWPGSALAQRLGRIFADGRIDDDEREDLLFFLHELTGTPSGAGLDVAVRALPLDEPMPRLHFAGNECVFAGHFVWGTRRRCEQAVIARGGVFARKVSERTNIVIVGELGDPDWERSRFGADIAEAVKQRAAGARLVIVDEEHWVSCL